MKIMNVRCNVCSGTGHHRGWEPIAEGILQAIDKPCTSCDGNGYTEHAVFSIEEAKAILKHCGLEED